MVSSKNAWAVLNGKTWKKVSPLKPHEYVSLMVVRGPEGAEYFTDALIFKYGK